MSIKDFLKKLINKNKNNNHGADKTENKTEDISDRMKIIDCPDCGSTETFVKWMFSPSTMNRETICPKCSFSNFEPWMKIRRTPEGYKQFHEENGSNYTEIEYRDKSRERVVSIQDEDYRRYNPNIENIICKKDCILLKRNSLNNKLVAVVRGVCGNKIAYYMLADCSIIDNDINFIKYKNGYIRSLNNDLFEIIKNDRDIFNSVAICCHDNSEKPPLSNKDFVKCTSCGFEDVLVVHKENISNINRTRVCPDCDYKEEILNVTINRDTEDVEKFIEKYGDSYVRIEYKDVKTEEFISMDRDMEFNVSVPKSKCMLIKNVSEKRFIAVVNGFYNNETSYYLLSNCYDTGFHKDILTCKRKDCHKLENEDLEKIENIKIVLKK